MKANNYLFSTTGEAILVSPEDFLWLKGATLYFSKGTGYVQIYVSGQTFHLHRFILALNEEDDRVVDHINHDPLDNRRENLRAVSHSQNHHNIVTYSTAGVEIRGKRFRAHIRINGRKTDLGTYSTMEQARKVYLIKKKELSGL